MTNHDPPHNDDLDGFEETSGDDAQRAAESAERAALAGGNDPLAGLLDRIRAEGSAPVFETPVLAALAAMRREQLPRFVAWVDAATDAAKASGRRLGRTGLSKALDAVDRAERAAAKGQRRPDAGEEDAATGLPVVVLGFDLPRIVSESVAALASCENLYQRASTLVRIVRSPGVPAIESAVAPAEQRAHERAVRRSPDEGSPIIEAVPAATMGELLAGAAEFRAPDRRARAGERRVHPPGELASRVLARRAYDPHTIRPLVSVVGSPAMLPSGEFLTRQGYHRGSGLYLDWHGPPVEVPEAPTQDDARAAAGRLSGIFEDFRFQGEEQGRRIALAALLAAILTPLARPSIDGPVPAFMLGADMPNAGKTLAAQACGALILGRAPAVRPWCEDADEMQKTLGAIALHAPPVALFDNIRAHVEGGALEALLTSDTYAARVLGASATPELPWRTTLYTTANNASYNSDTARRFVHVLLRGVGSVTAGEAPGQTVRVFKHPRLMAHVLEHRPAYLRDALTILRGHALAGRPAGANLDSFEAWSAVVSSAVLWAWGTDPALARPPEDANRDHSTARTVVAVWCATLRDRPLTLSALRERLGAEPRLSPLRDALADLCDVPELARASAKSLGSRLARVAGRSTAAPWGGTMRLETRKNGFGTMVYTATCTQAPPLSDDAGPQDGDAFDHPAAPPPFPPREQWPASWREFVAEREAMAYDGGAPDPSAAAEQELRTAVDRGELPRDA